MEGRKAGRKFVSTNTNIVHIVQRLRFNEINFSLQSRRIAIGWRHLRVEAWKIVCTVCIGGNVYADKSTPQLRREHASINCVRPHERVLLLSKSGPATDLVSCRFIQLPLGQRARAYHHQLSLLICCASDVDNGQRNGRQNNHKKKQR